MTRTQLTQALRDAGVTAGGILMVHTRMSAIGQVIGGADTVVSALLECLGPEGTLVVYTAWEHDAYEMADWPPQRQAAYRGDPPVFDPLISEAWSGVGRIPERVRTWPGAHRSAHPLASVAAIGAQAETLVRGHRLGDGYGATSPLAKLVAQRGEILLLGAPLDTLTILHHAEAISDRPGKRHYRFPARLRSADGTVDVEVDDIDTTRGAYDYTAVEDGGSDAFEILARDALEAGVGRAVSIAHASSYLFDAAALVAFAVAWLDRLVSAQPPPTSTGG
ncbi:MAG: aminoglycoside 3-N-acetyltransferase [Candidatus Dormibacteria bacterium]